MLGWVAGQIHIRVEGGALERLLNDCRKKQIPLAKIVPTELGFEGWIPTRRYTDLQHLVEKRQCRLEMLEQTRPLVNFDFLSKRWGLVAGPVILLCIIAGANNLVWAVRFDGLNVLQQQQVRQELYEQGIFEGAWMDKEDLEQAHNNMMQKGEYGWLTLNFYRGRLVVEKSDRIPAPFIEQEQVSDIVSIADGIITDINVRSGDILCLLGQQIAKGQLLVSGQYADRDGRMFSTQSKGEIFVQTKVEYQAEQPLEQTVLVPEKAVTSNRFLLAFGRRFALGKIHSPSKDDIVKTVKKPLLILGFALPATIEQQQIVHTKQQTVTFTQQQALELAKLSCRKQLEQDFPQAVIETESMQFGVENGTVKIKMEFIANVQAGKEVLGTE